MLKRSSWSCTIYNYVLPYCNRIDTPVVIWYSIHSMVWKGMFQITDDLSRLFQNTLLSPLLFYRMLYFSIRLEKLFKKSSWKQLLSLGTAEWSKLPLPFFLAAGCSILAWTHGIFFSCPHWGYLNCFTCHLHKSTWQEAVTWQLVSLKTLFCPIHTAT